MTDLEVHTGRIRQSCDKCYSLRRKCDLELPSCSMCKLKNIQCTRLRKVIKKPMMYDNEEFHNQSFSLILNKRKGNKKYNKHNSVKINTQFNDSFYQHLNSIFNSKVYRVDTLSSCISIFPIKAFYSPLLMDDLQNYIYKRNPSLGVKMVFDQTKVESLEIVKLENNLFKLNEFKDLIYKAMEAYFKRVNTLLPLFTKKQFYNKARSLKLIYSISLVGLSLLPSNENTNSIAKYLKSYLYYSFQPSRACRSLGDLQSMVVLVNGLRGHKYSLSSYYFTNLKRCCLMLGLHLVPHSKSINFDTLIERKLCYSAALFLNSLDDPFYLRNFEHHYLWKYQQKDLNKLLNYKIDENIIKYNYLVMAKFYYYAAISLQRMLELFLYSNDLKIDNGKALNILNWVGQLLLFSSKRAMFRLEKIKNNLKQFDIISINRAISTINLIYNSCAVSIFDMEELALYSSSDNIFSTHHIEQPVKDTKLLESYYINVLKYNDELGIELISTFRYYSYIVLQRSLSSHEDIINKHPEYLSTLNTQFYAFCQNSLSKELFEVLNKLIFCSNLEK